MEKTHRVAQIYGYLVCLVAVITFLICTAQLVNSLIDLGDPIHAGWTPESAPSLASYENYKMDILKSTNKAGETTSAAYVPDEQTLHVMYQAARDNKVQLEKHRAIRSIIINGLLVVICIVLFITHWLWMLKLSKMEL
ncbi:MAG: hypothetical protein AB7S48_01105 [Bacteroidales bacterium]